MNTPFTDAFQHLNPEEHEAYHRAVFMQMDTPEAAEVRLRYYRSVLRAMGKDVRIGCGVRFINPQQISLGDGVSIDDNCMLIARSARGIHLGDRTQLKVGVYLDIEGMCVCVLWSADIGDGSVIGSGTVVVKPIPPYSVAVGTPARVIRQRQADEPMTVNPCNDRKPGRSKKDEKMA